MSKVKDFQTKTPVFSDMFSEEFRFDVEEHGERVFGLNSFDEIAFRLLIEFKNGNYAFTASSRDAYFNSLEKEIDIVNKLDKKGKLKGYSSGDELVDALNKS